MRSFGNHFKIKSNINFAFKNLVIIFALMTTMLTFSLNPLLGQEEKKKDKIDVAVLVYDGVYLLDFTGPMEVFFDAVDENGEHLFNVYTVSPGEEIRAHSGLRMFSDFNTGNCPQPDIFVVPGGDLTLLQNKPELKVWLVKTAESAETVLSVCTGAFILADAELLEGLSITTWSGAHEKLQKVCPNSKVIKDVRYTDNGKVVTTAGVSAGIDGSLFVVSKYFGKKVADKTAQYMDYEYWK